MKKRGGRRGRAGQHRRIAENTPEARAVLRLANEGSRETFVSIGLRAISVDAILATRSGDDELLGTSDDLTFTSLAMLDAVPWVGPAEFQKLLDHARSLGWVDASSTPCTFEKAFVERYGQAFDPNDVAFLLTDGSQVRGLGGLSLDRYGMPAVNGKVVREIRLLGPEVYSVRATRSGANWLRGLAHAIELQASGAPWASEIVRTTLMRQLVMSEPTAHQVLGAMQALVAQAEASAPAERRASFAHAGAQVLRQYERNEARLPNGEFSVLSYQPYTFHFYYYWGMDPSLGVRGLVQPGEVTWIGLAGAPTCGGCSFGSFQGAQYAYCEKPETWPRAEAACNAMGGHLASVRDKGDNGAIRALHPASGYAWIGLHAPLENGVFTWVDESPVQWLNWQVGEPNNHGGAEHCVNQGDITGPAGQRSTAWNDLPCDWQLPYVCRL
jgi:hypothetical protein